MGKPPTEFNGVPFIKKLFPKTTKFITKTYADKRGEREKLFERTVQSLVGFSNFRYILVVDCTINYRPKNIM